jgi:atypical dual specificity phosphatase
MKRMTRVAACLAALLAVACSGEGSPQDEVGAVQHDEAESMVTPMPGFSWVVDGRVAGMPRPGTARPLERDLDFLRAQGIDVLVSLTETPVDATALARHGIQPLHIPVQDFHAPTIAQLDEYVRAVEAWTAAGHHVGTHCGAGKGRTGTFLAALFVARGWEADAAIAEIRRLRPGSIETALQAQAVRDYALFLAHRRLPPLDEPSR